MAVYRRTLGTGTSLALALWLIGITGPLLAQESRLPDIPPRDQSFPGRPVSYPDTGSEILQIPGQAGVPQLTAPGTAPQYFPPGYVQPGYVQPGYVQPGYAQPGYVQPDGTVVTDLPPGARPGVFQRLIFEGGWLVWRGGDDFGMADLEAKTVFGLPLPTRDSPLLITPGFAVHYLDGPESVALPPRVYDAYTQFRWMSRLTPQLGVDMAITPGVSSDFERWSSQAFRLTAHGAAMWSMTPDFKLVLGAAYLDRKSVEVLPIGGFVWTPNEDVELELVFPHPRIAQRLYSIDACTKEVQDWVYVAGELGGGAWAIERTGGWVDVMDYTDYRVFVGLERRMLGGLNSRIELGYVFGRRLRFDSGTPPTIRPDDTIMLRGGVSY